MFKTLLRTLSALSIVTITASAGFAQSTSDTDCAAPWNQDHEDCTATTKIWLESISAEPLPIDDIRNTNGKANRFVRFGPNGFNDAEGNALLMGNPKKGELNLTVDVVNDDSTMAKKTIGGVLFYREVNTDTATASYNYNAGIKSGTDLGRPLTADLVGAEWSGDWAGNIRTVWNNNPNYHLDTGFTLKVTFGGTTAPGNVGKIYALVNQRGTAYYRIDGDFDSKGLITGNVTYGFFNASLTPNDRPDPYTNVGRINGTLSGLIGDQGAAGVFVSNTTTNPLKGFAGGFVVKGFTADRTALLRRCAFDPFDVQCSNAEFAARKIARIVYCTEGNNLEGSGKNCDGAIAATGANSCILNPFQTACKDANADYAEQYVIARAERAVFCGKSTNSNSDLCQGDTIVADVCGVNPFGEVCEDRGDSTTHKDRRVELINNCNDDIMDNNAGCPAVRDVIDACQTDPFGANCGFDVFDEARKVLVKTCLAARNCAGQVLKRPNVATWENSLKTIEGNPIVLSDLPDADTYDENNPFLKNIESARTNENIKTHAIYYGPWNLKTATFNGIPLGGDAEDGADFFLGSSTDQDDPRRQYGGVFSTTDLGAPLTTETGIASWVGSFRAGFYDSVPKDFVLEVNFEGRSIEAFTRHRYGSRSLLLKGDYDDNGVISGTVVSNRFTDNNRNKQIYNSGYREEINLTGLIGKEGAVGVFVNWGYQGGFVARPADDVDGAVDYLDGVCDVDDGNPFHEFCYLRQDARKAVIDRCITGENVLNDDDCLSAREYHFCILYPFDQECKTDFVDHYEIARDKRNDFCNDPANTGDNFNTLCTGAAGVALCSYDPFNRLCADAIYNNARKVVCRSELDSGRCANYQPSGNVTTASWLSSIHEDTGFIPLTEPDTIVPRNQFLQGTEDGLDNGDVEISSYYGGLQSLNLNTAIFDGLELGKDKNKKDREAAADNGVAFFEDVNRKGYAGIFSGTDLGAPLDRPTTAEWYGQFQVGYGYKTDFTLEIDLNIDGTGTVMAFINSRGSDWYYLLDGDVDKNGVISGTVVSGRSPNHDRIFPDITHTAVLTGLIGQEGAVGAFIGDFYLNGGFVALPSVAFDRNVKASDWLRSFGNTPGLPIEPSYRDTQQTAFLQGRERGLDTRRIGNAVSQTLTLAGVRTDGEAADGVAYASGTQHSFYNPQTRYRGNITRHVAGILSGTYLGAVLPTMPADANGSPITAIWDGKLGLMANQVEIPRRDFKLAVDFTNNKISYSDAINGAHFVDLSANWESGVGYDGVLKGKITYNAGAALALDDTDSKGTVSGLIGTDGAVGAFISDEGSATPYAGGFVAVPSDVFSQTVSFSDWVSSFGNTSPLLTRVPWSYTQQTLFLRSTETGLDRFLLRNVVRPDSPLTLANGDLGGHITDGVAYMYGTHYNDAQNTHHVAGILFGTNLGAVLEVRPAVNDTDTTANWAGNLGMIVNGASPVESSITLDVNYTKKNITLNRTAIGLGAVSFTDVGWDNTNGVLSGAITYDPNDSTTNITGTVKGLIGQQGAVGAFISDGTGDISYAGGFVAAPGVNYLNWMDSFGNPTSLPVSVPWYSETQPQTEFLQGRETDLNPGFINNPVPRTLKLSDGDLGGEAADGVAYMSGTWEVLKPGTTVRMNVPRHYAGILSGTSLGALLEVKPAVDGTDIKADWAGKLGMIVNGASPVESNITLEVNYTKQNITLNRTAIGLGAVSFANVGWDNTSGVLTGAITYDPNDSALADSTGKVTGLIGQQGAVGAFISNHDNPSSKAAYAGGFVAAPTQ